MMYFLGLDADGETCQPDR